MMEKVFQSVVKCWVKKKEEKLKCWFIKQIM